VPNLWKKQSFLLQLDENLCEAIADGDAIHWRGGALSHELANLQQWKQVAPSQTKVLIMAP
jgi:hypothetical protein